MVLPTHWGRVMHTCVRKLIIIGWGKGLPPGSRQAIIWTDAGTLLIEPLGTKLSENFNRNSYLFVEADEFEDCRL